MRERGHYWAKYASSSEPSIIFFDGRQYWEIGHGFPRNESYWHSIGEKVQSKPVEVGEVVKYVPGAMCKKHLIYYKIRDGGGGYTVEYCPKCDEENNPFAALRTQPQATVVEMPTVGDILNVITDHVFSTHWGVNGTVDAAKAIHALLTKGRQND